MTSICRTTVNHVIKVLNLKSGEEVSYSLLLIKGIVITIDQSLCPCHEASLCLINSNHASVMAPKTFWPLKNSEFKCLLSLRKGMNEFILKYCSVELKFNVEYAVRPTELSVSPVYIICKGHNGRFQSPDCEDNSIESACERISIGMKLIQTLIAEKLFECGYGHKSFVLSSELYADAPECHVFYSKLLVEQAWGMTPSALWEYFARELMTSNLASKSKKYVAFISCTRYIGSSSDNLPSTHEDILALTNAHAALGGGGLALFGSACLHTWPCSFEEIVPRFLCSKIIDKARFMDDSCYRGTYGACFSTTLGSVCHELGHTFDLGHTKEGIMGSGYNNVKDVFILYDAFHQRRSVRSSTKSYPLYETVSFSQDLIFTFENNTSVNREVKRDNRAKSDVKGKRVGPVNEIVKSMTEKSLKYQNDDNHDGIYWSESCSAILAYHRWLNPTDHHDHKTSLSFNKQSSTVSSPLGIRVIEIRDAHGTVLESWVFNDSNLQLEFSLVHYLNYTSGSNIVAMDSTGSILKETLEYFPVKLNC